MKILLLAATQMEVASFLQSQPHIDIIIGGVGMVSTTFCLTRQLLHHRYDCVVQAGIGGLYASHTSQLQLGEVVTVSRDCFADLGAYEKGRLFSLQDLELNLSPEWLINTHPLLPAMPFKTVAATTVNMVTDDECLIKAISQKWDPAVESMEGAAFHYVCMQKQVPFIQLRAISNQVGERNKSQWQIKAAIENLQTALEVVIPLLK